MDQKSPDAFRTISEVAEWLDTPAHVLRFWESRFAQVKPVKRAGGRRYYRPSDMALLGGIKKLLHEDGLTIRGVQKILRSQGVRYVASLSPPLEDGGAPMLEGAEPAASPPADILVLHPPAAEAPSPQAEPEPEPAAGQSPREPEFAFDAPPAAAAAAAPPLAAAARRPDDEDWDGGGDEDASDASFEAELAWALGLDAAAGAVAPGAAASAAAGAAAGEDATPRDETPEEAAPEVAAPQEAAPPSAPEPSPAERVAAAIAALGPLPGDGDGGGDAGGGGGRFVPRPLLPLADPRAVRARLAAEPAAAAALYARMIDLAARMAERAR
jgi:DNA-binding transcriptional MerR regulator